MQHSFPCRYYIGLLRRLLPLPLRDTRKSCAVYTASANGAIIGNKKNKVYHRPDCPSAAKISPKSRVRFATGAEAQAAG